MLKILNRNQEPIGYLTSAKNAQHRRRLNGEVLLSFEIPKHDEEVDLLQLDAFVVLEGQKYLIKNIEESEDGRQLFNVQCVHVYIELVDEYIDRTVELLGVTCSQAVTEALQGTEFTVGSITAVGNHDIDLSELNVLKALQLIREKWDCDMWFDNRTVHFGAQGVNRNAEIRYGKNLKTLRRPSSVTDVITRLYVYGKDGLTIESVNGGKKYLDSPNIGLYRRPKIATIRFNEIDAAGELKLEGQKYLLKNDTVKVSYQVDFWDLRKLGYPEEEIDLGDPVTITHMPFNLQTIGSRVVEIIDFPLERRATTVTLSSFIETTVDDVVSIKRRQGSFERYATGRHAELQTQTNEIGEAQVSFETYVESAYRDGLITASEAKAIGEHKRQLAKEKSDLDAEYTKIYNSAFLPAGAVKSSLNTAMNQYNTSYNALIAAIDSTIADSIVTPAEKGDLDAKFSDLATKLFVLRAALEDALNAITATAESNAKGYTDTNYGDTKQKVQNGDLFVRDKYGQIIANTDGLHLEEFAGFGIQKGGVIRIENRTHAVVKTALTQPVGFGATTIHVADTSAFPPIGNLYISSASTTGFAGIISYTSKTATTFTVPSGFYDYPLPGSVYLWTQPVGDIVVSPMTVVLPSGAYFQTAEKRFNGRTLGASRGDLDGWSFLKLWVDTNGVVQMAAQGTEGGFTTYPTNPPAGSVRIGYILLGYGGQDPDGTINDKKDYGTDGYPNFKEQIYHDVRYRDERALRSENNDVLLGGTPYGVQTLAVNVAAGSYQTFHIRIGKGKRSVNLSLTLDDGSGYDNYTYGASLVVGRKAANNADGKGRPLWATYVDADGARGHVAGQRNLAPYGVHILSPRVWNRAYTLLYDADLMPDPTDPAFIAIKLTFYNYGPASESFSLRANWHAL